MITQERIKRLRGSSAVADAGDHPIIELSDDELRMAIGGVDARLLSSTGSFSYSTGPFCCDGTKVCCN